MTDEESVVKTVNKYLDLKPGVAGISISLNEILERLHELYQSRRGAGRDESECWVRYGGGRLFSGRKDCGLTKLWGCGIIAPNWGCSVAV